MEGEETEKRALRGTGLHPQELPKGKGVQEQGPLRESTPHGKIQGTAHGTKRAHTPELNESEMQTEPKVVRESLAPARLGSPQSQEETEGDEKEEASEGVKRAPRRRRAGVGIQEAGENMRRSCQKQEPREESKPKEKILERSPTPAPPSRGVPHGTCEDTTRSQPKTVEVPRNRQKKIAGPTAAPRVEGEETTGRASWGTSLQWQGPPGRNIRQEQRPPYESEPQGKTQDTANTRKKNHDLALNDPEMPAEP